MAALLDAQQLAVAAVAHAHWVKRLGPIAGLEDVLQVAAFQAAHALPVDGILAPPTRAAHRNEPFAWPVGDALLCGGRLHQLPEGLFAVHPDDSLALTLAETGCYRPRDAQEQAKIDLLVLHWDECESSLHCFHTLLWRGLSAHLLLAADGTLFQTLDLAHSCAYHARTHNPRSVGIEINNALFPAPVSGQEEPALSRTLVCEPRAHAAERWHITGFTPAQHRTLERLVPWLCELLGIPPELPLDEAGEVQSGLIAADFAGVCGHFHLQQDKVDPGFSLWPTLKKAVGAQNVG